MIKALLDTDTLVALLRGDEGLAARIRSKPSQSFAVSTVSLYELCTGVEKSHDPQKNRRLLEDALAPFSVIPFDPKAAMEAARVRSTLEKQGKSIGPYDTLIAGHALSIRCPLITANEREFRRVSGLKLENWIGSR